ncbi:preprotein translocase subunit YajC [Aneurinibacillus tyrosinisolvens]|uniref:preprotein translocase subunit YajC n=1 Tax=Aneurinibacillus tyrosinisolvens TaxID=1443435 RepID=UPI00063F5452|nr:preprotein translocase subunit YajC [Aneurinibacillus tyrosinisolvens]
MPNTKVNSLEQEKKLGELKVGDRIIHTTFGKGLIRSIHENGVLAEINFNEEIKRMNLEVLVTENLITRI